MRLQVVRDRAIAFQGGYHDHHWPGFPDPRVAVEASIRATIAGDTIGRPIAEWATGRTDGLGVNASITVHDETTPTPYITRPHDQQLRQKVSALTISGASSQLVIAVGNSCAGKTRALYEAILAVLPDWHLVAPTNDTDLAHVLMDGVPARTVLWLDELQNKLTKLSDGVIAAKGITALLDSERVGSILVAGSIWPTELQSLTQRPTPEEAGVGAAAIPDLLANAVTVLVPDVFSDVDLVDAPDDPRLNVAIATATQETDGRKITQVLAGGVQLVNRLRCDPGAAVAFSPAARAVIHAAGDLRRVGIPNPIPRWALEGAAPGHLGSPPPPGSLWFHAALNQLTAAAAADDHFTGTHTLDIHVDGVPALTPTSHLDGDGTVIEAFDLHEYLYQDHLGRHRYSPTSPLLWDALLANSFAVSSETLLQVASNARRRGLYRRATELNRELADRGDSKADRQLVELLRIRASGGDERAETELRALAANGSRAAAEMLPLHVADLAAQGYDDAEAELRDRAESDELFRDAWRRVLFQRALKGSGQALASLRRGAQKYMHFDSAFSKALYELALSGDSQAETQLRQHSSYWGRHYASLLNREPTGFDRTDDRDLLVAQARAGDRRALEQLRSGSPNDRARVPELLVDLISAGEVDLENDLRQLAGDSDPGDPYAQPWLTTLLLERYAAGDRRAQSDLLDMVHSARWSAALGLVERERRAGHRVIELDTEAHPVVHGLG